MAENRVTIEDTNGDRLAVRADGSINTVTGVPEGAKFYLFKVTGKGQYELQS